MKDRKKKVASHRLMSGAIIPLQCMLLCSVIIIAQACQFGVAKVTTEDIPD